MVVLLLVPSRLGKVYLPAGILQVCPGVDFGKMPLSTEGIDYLRLWANDNLNPVDFEGGATRAVRVPPHPGRECDIKIVQEDAALRAAQKIKRENGANGVLDDEATEVPGAPDPSLSDPGPGPAEPDFARAHRAFAALR